MSNRQFEELIAKGHSVGEIVGVDRFLVRVKGLQPINVHALVQFEDGSKGYVHHIYEDYVVVLHLGTESLRVGMVAVVQHPTLVTKVGKNYIGRVVTIFGEPLDGKGPIPADDVLPVFNKAPMLYERELLDTQLETGVTVLDTMFSLVRGQRMAILGDSKSGKTTLTTQIAINQRSTDIIVIYVLIAKRHSDVSQLLDRLQKNGAMDTAIVVVATMFESLIVNYLAPYIGCSLGEYLWQYCDMDTLVIYDDLTSHAQAYREISLIAGVSPGRDSYPGDSFYIHSSLVERAGKLNRNHKSQTVLPIVYAPNGDITAYLPTNVMSMTDGQWILDMAVFRDTMRPAISTGLSVTRVGGVGQNSRQKKLTGMMGKAIAAYKQAEEYAHFGSELSAEATANLEKGRNLYALMNQIPGETYDLLSQQLMLDIVLNLKPEEMIDLPKLKSMVAEFASQIREESPEDESSNFNTLRDQLKAQCLLTEADKARLEQEKLERQRRELRELAERDNSPDALGGGGAQDGGQPAQQQASEAKPEEPGKEGQPPAEEGQKPAEPQKPEEEAAQPAEPPKEEAKT